jgi:hypothetical protein
VSWKGGKANRAPAAIWTGVGDSVMRGNEEGGMGLTVRKTTNLTNLARKQRYEGRGTLTAIQQEGSLLSLNPSASKRNVKFVNAS